MAEGRGVRIGGVHSRCVAKTEILFRDLGIPRSSFHFWGDFTLKCKSRNFLGDFSKRDFWMDE